MKKIAFLILTNLFCSFCAFPQSVGVNDFMRLNPYSSLNNPAYFMPYDMYVGIPAASNFNLSYYYSSNLYKNIFETFNDPNRTKLSVEKFLKSLKGNNWINTELNTELLGFGFRVKDYFFSFSYRLKMDEHFKYTSDLFGFLLQDVNSYTRISPAEFSMETNVNLYQEMSLGFQGKILDNLYVGARPKLLFGLVNLKTAKLNATIYRDPSNNEVYGSYDADIYGSSIIPLFEREANGKLAFTLDPLRDLDSYSRYAKNAFKQNVGFSIDLGAVYRINQHFRVSASVTDLGFIHWKGSPLNKQGGTALHMKFGSTGDVKFDGYVADQLTNYINSGNKIDFDSIFGIINSEFIFEEVKSYNTFLTSKIMTDVYFDLDPYNRFIFQCKGYIYGKNFLPTFTFAYNGTFFNAIDVVVSYTMMKKSFANFGVGVGFRAGPFHIYAGTDNLFALLNTVKTTKGSVTFGLVVDTPFLEKVKEPKLKSWFNFEQSVPEIQTSGNEQSAPEIQTSENEENEPDTPTPINE
jgi:hypothetical protein